MAANIFSVDAVAMAVLVTAIAAGLALVPLMLGRRAGSEYAMAGGLAWLGVLLFVTLTGIIVVVLATDVSKWVFSGWVLTLHVLVLGGEGVYAVRVLREYDTSSATDIESSMASVAPSSGSHEDAGSTGTEAAGEAR